LAGRASGPGPPGPRDRVAGAFLGLAVGDALGTALEFRPPGTFPAIDDMVGGGPFQLRPGEWTDDTAMALCLAESLIARGGHDPADQMDRYLRWHEEGHNSPTGHCFDIGGTVLWALRRYRADGDPVAGDPSPRLAGNGGLMRLAPAVLYFHREPGRALDVALESTATTHGAPQALAAADLFGRMLLAALDGKGKEAIVGAGADGAFQAPSRRGEPYHPEVAAIARGEGLETVHDYEGGGYVVHTLRIALHAFLTTDSFEEGALRAVNVGGDADTNGAVFGQLAGAHAGLAGIPERWRSRLAGRERLLEVADALWRGPEPP
jgi:ADP-ribosyl-[dinitrogen reductase] hydrolase